MTQIPSQHLSDTAQVDQQSIQPFPNSRKIYVQGSRPDILVPMREISLTPTETDNGIEENAPVFVYDTSGPYTDPNVSIDVRKGLPDVRSSWIEERGDTEILSGLSSQYGQQRLNAPELSAMRFASIRNPRRARQYAKDNDLTDEQRAIEAGFKQQSERFREEGSIIYKQV